MYFRWRGRCAGESQSLSKGRNSLSSSHDLTVHCLRCLLRLWIPLLSARFLEAGASGGVITASRSRMIGVWNPLRTASMLSVAVSMVITGLWVIDSLVGAVLCFACEGGG